MTVMLGAELHSIASLIRDQRYDTSLIGREDAHKMGVFPASFYVLELRRIPETGPKFGGFGPAAFPVILALALRCFVASVLSSIRHPDHPYRAVPSILLQSIVRWVASAALPRR